MAGRAAESESVSGKSERTGKSASAKGADFSKIKEAQKADKAEKVAEEEESPVLDSTSKAAGTAGVDAAAFGQKSNDIALYGAEVDFAVSGRATEVASKMRSYWILEQEADLREGLPIASEQKEKTGKSGKKEETEFQKQLREKLEQARSLDTMFKRMRELNEQAKKKEGKKKKVQYSYRRVSAAISGAKTSTQASLALSTASANLSSLKRKAASGQYESKEMEVALAHAQKMVRVARKKVQNIKWEVQQQKRNRSKEKAKKQQNALIRSTPRKAKEEKALLRLKEQLKAQEKSKQHKNRRDEDMKLMSADMTYLQRKIDLLKQETSSVSVSGSTITVSAGLTEEMTELAESTGNMQAAADVAKSAATEAGTTAESVYAESD